MIKTHEHEVVENIPESVKSKFKKSNLEKISPENFLGLHYELEKGQPVVKAYYYIGLCWLEENETLMVKPKIDNLNYLKMFMDCFKQPEISEHLNKIYKIYIDEPPISIENNPFELTPFLIVHFLNVVESIVKKGLKKGYVKVNENLTSKIKGKILVNQTIKKNHLNFRFDKTYCNYELFTIDCEENRILKKALVFANKFLFNNPIYNELQQLLRFNLSFFENVSDTIENERIKHIKVNSFFHEYKQGLELAKLILRYVSYSPHEEQRFKIDKFPPFYINMALLFELYAYGKLIEIFGHDNIVYQYKSDSGIPDFLNTDNQEILDAKYKTQYANSYELEDIRQLSGYARDVGINQFLKKASNAVLDCFIVYPVLTPNNVNISNYKRNPISGFTNFYKIGISVPLKI